MTQPAGYPQNSLRAFPRDWTPYADGQEWDLKRGEHFYQTPLQLRYALRRFAQRRNLSISTKIVDDNTLRVRMAPRTAS